jgi:hypothetical protein
MTVTGAADQPRFQVRRDRLGPTTQRLQIQQRQSSDDWAAVTWQQAIALLQQDVTFADVLTQGLAAAPWSAFFWETPPITPTSLPQPWECVTVEAPALATIQPDPQPFRRAWAGASGGTVATFPNLGGDAWLVVPRPQGDEANYTHLAAFLRSASAQHCRELWQTLGTTVQRQQMSAPTQPLWVSTSGLGVHWLHIRLDQRPKYYTHPPYCTVV